MQMSDDIDIEEHDVLENPVIKNLFPDISVIKKEISQYYEDVPDIKEEAEINTIENNVPKVLNTNAKADDAKQTKEQPSSEIGPSRDAVQLQTETVQNKLKKYVIGTKIILGSKPNKTVGQTQTSETEAVEEQKNPSKSVVRIPKLMLQDLGDYIYRSDRYCEDCKTLFPSKSDLNDHKLKSHTVTTQHKQVTEKITIKGVKMKVNENGKNECEICGSNFSSRANLSRHFKNIHKKVTANNQNCVVKPSRVSPVNGTKETLNKPDMIYRESDKNALKTRNKPLNVKVTLESKNNSENNDFKQRNYIVSLADTETKKRLIKDKPKENAPVNNNKCTICGSCFSNRANLFRHYRNVHKKKLSVKLKQKIFNRAHNLSNKMSKKSNKETSSPSLNSTDAKHECFHCNKRFFDQKCLIEHIYTMLESKQYLRRRRNKVSDVTKENNRKTKVINKELSSEKIEGISLKDKLIFENEDSDNADSASSRKRKFKHVDCETQPDKSITVTRKLTKFAKLKENDKSKSLDQPLQKKRKHNDSDEDTSSVEGSFLDTDETYENISSQSSILHKKQKLTTEYSNSMKVTSETSGVNSKLNLSNKQVTWLKKKTNPKKRPHDTSSKNVHNRVGLRRTKSHQNNVKSSLIYECAYCSFIPSSSRAYFMHMHRRHKLEDVSRCHKVVFNLQCKYCPSRVSQSYRNKHLRLCHYDLLTKSHNKGDVLQRNKEATELKYPAFQKVESFVLKSIVFKCMRCDVHFLSSCVAKDHEKHMELLINWKCSICTKIFKKHDKRLHLKQHTFSETINVCEFDQSELSRLLYNCTKCAIHFTEAKYLKHFSECGNNLTDSVYCKNCDILIDKREYATHEAYHKMGKNTTDIIVISGDIITKNQEDMKSLEMSCLQDKKKKNQDKHIYKPMKCLTFCQICKCYLSDMAINRKAHVEARCSNIVKYTCPTCGLVFTNKSINTHRSHHKQNKRLNLQYFVFYDFNGIKIRPPIPEYPSCNNCEVTFVGRNAIKGHICTETEYIKCEICNLKLSESAYKLHMNFHNYCIPNEKVDQSIDVMPKDLLQKEIGLEKQAKVMNKNLCATMAKKDKRPTAVRTDSQKVIDDVNKSAGISVDLTIEKQKMLSKQQNYNTKAVVEVDHKDVAESNTRINIILYTCLSCNISVDAYDKVIEHCQNHFDPKPVMPSRLVTCCKCSLKFEDYCYEIHQKLLFLCNTLPVLTFDPTYFTSDNNTWVRHIFASTALSVQKQVLETSIYQYERRIKVEVLQQNPPHLSVHKCYRCGIFVDPDSLITHIRDGCYKTPGKHPCSLCGLPFTSSLSRTKHEEIHKRYENLRLKSYNILLVNNETHNSYNSSIFNAMKKYILYQCRSCYVIVDKLQRSDHKCNINDLSKCSDCGLILYKEDFKTHCSKHSDLALYNTANMKVVLFGNKEESISNNTLLPSFSGLVSDYKLYKCSKCEDCENDKKFISKHVCTFDDSKWKCPKCGNYISARSIKQHIKMHDDDTEFTTENFACIHFEINKGEHKRKEMRCEDFQTKQVGAMADFEKGSSSAQINHKLDLNKENSKIDEQAIDYVAFYKCVCGLHYMDEMAAKNHAKQCCPNMKIIRQKCSKCSLTFNPKELFSHILAHHGDKNKIFKYNVVEVKAENVV